MAGLSSLPGWSRLTKEEKDRLKKISAPRVKLNYNIGGELSVGKKELVKGEKQDE
jgi:hypothetical protein